MDEIGIEVMTMFIMRAGNTVDECNTDNIRDSDNPKLISQFPYDRIIYNDGDLPQLDEKVYEFINELFD